MYSWASDQGRTLGCTLSPLMSLIWLHLLLWDLRMWRIMLGHNHSIHLQLLDQVSREIQLYGNSLICKCTCIICLSLLVGHWFDWCRSQPVSFFSIRRVCQSNIWITKFPNRVCGTFNHSGYQGVNRDAI